MPNPVVHFVIIGNDQSLLEGFYRDVFGWKITPMIEGYSMVDTMSKPGSGIGGGIGAADEARRHVTFYVSVADVNAALASIEANGGKKTFGPHPTPDGGIIACFTDPEGHLIGLVQPQTEMCADLTPQNQ
jgi:predicted enzyme related to lactoylglutathione lyase